MNYKKVMPIFLAVALFGTAAYSVNSRVEIQQDYKAAITEARSYAEKGIEKDALAAYGEAISLKPDLDTYLEAGKVYMDHQDYTGARKWYRTMSNRFPKEPETYLYGIELYLAAERYPQAFEVYDEYQGRELHSDAVEEAMDSIRYRYSMSGSYEDVGVFGLTSKTAPVSHNGLWGYVDSDLSYHIPFIFKEAESFTSYAAVVDEEGNPYYIDTEGNVRINSKLIEEADPKFGAVKKFGPIQSSLILAYNGKVWNYYQEDSLDLLCGGYKKALPIGNGVGAVSKDGKKWALLDASGKEITKFSYDEILADQKQIIAQSGVIIAGQSGKYVLLDTAGNQLSKTKYEDAKAFNDNTYAAVRKDKYWSFIDTEGKEVLTGKYEDAESFSYGLAAVKQGGKWGFIDTEGNLVIPCLFEDAKPFMANGMAFVKGEKDTWQLLKLYLYNH